MTTTILTYFDNRITINPDICNGKPTLRNKRITVQTVLEREDITACLQFATHLMEQHYALKTVA